MNDIGYRLLRSPRRKEGDAFASLEIPRLTSGATRFAL
jgi:hypothetical protein